MIYQPIKKNYSLRTLRFGARKLRQMKWEAVRRFGVGHIIRNFNPEPRVWIKPV